MNAQEAFKITTEASARITAERQTLTPDQIKAVSLEIKKVAEKGEGSARIVVYSYDDLMGAKKWALENGYEVDEEFAKQEDFIPSAIILSWM